MDNIGSVHQYSNTSSEIPDQFFEFDDWNLEDNPLFVASGYAQTPNHAITEAIDSAGGSIPQQHELERQTSREGESGREKKEIKEKVAFKTKSEVEILDDGFKWRKYGKKMVKNSPNPRNYYRCSYEGCKVKKRVERDKEDPRYVITTYEGIHNHQGPSQY